MCECESLLGSNNGDEDLKPKHGKGQVADNKEDWDDHRHVGALEKLEPGFQTLRDRGRYYRSYETLKLVDAYTATY